MEGIEILEYVSGQLGIATDWTSDSVLPQAMEVMTRYIQYEIAMQSILMAIGAIMLGLSFVLIFQLIRNYEAAHKSKQTNQWFDCNTCENSIYINGFGILGVGITVALLLIGTAVFITYGLELLQWVLIPEIKVLENLSGFLSK